MKVIITLEDRPGGVVDFCIGYEPPQRRSAKEMNESMAARMGLAIEQFLKKQAVCDESQPN